MFCTKVNGGGGKIPFRPIGTIVSPMIGCVYSSLVVVAAGALQKGLNALRISRYPYV